MDPNTQNAWNWLGYIVHDYTTQLISWVNGISSYIQGSY